MNRSKLERDVRFLKIYAVLSSLVVVALAGAACVNSSNRRIAVLDVERINVVEPDGRLALVLSNRDRIPGPVVEGRELPRELSSGRRGSAGMIFFNARGDEVGGLTFSGEASGDSYAAGGTLAFDQFNQDQVVAVEYADGQGSRSAGIRVWDRSTTVSIADVVSLIERSRGPAGAARDSAAQALGIMQASGALGASRIFLGSRNRTAALRINDTQGRARIRMYVDSTNAARLEFLDEEGRVVESWPRGR